MSLSEAETAVMRCSQKIGYVNSISTFGMMWDTSAIYDNNGGDVFFQMAGPCQRDVFIFDRRVVRERGEWEACASVKFSWRFFQSAAFSGRATVFFFFLSKKANRSSSTWESGRCVRSVARSIVPTLLFYCWYLDAQRCHGNAVLFTFFSFRLWWNDRQRSGKSTTGVAHRRRPSWNFGWTLRSEEPLPVFDEAFRTCHPRV